MTSARTSEKSPSSQNSSYNISPRTELCSSEASAILEQRKPLKTTKNKFETTKTIWQSKKEKNPKKKKTYTNERKITETITTVQISCEQTTTETCKISEKMDLHITSASAGKIDRQDNNTDLNFCDTTTAPGLTANSESKLLLSIQLSSKSCEKTTRKGKDQT